MSVAAESESSSLEIHAMAFSLINVANLFNTKNNMARTNHPNVRSAHGGFYGHDQLNVLPGNTGAAGMLSGSEYTCEFDRQTHMQRFVPCRPQCSEEQCLPRS